MEKKSIICYLILFIFLSVVNITELTAQKAPLSELPVNESQTQNSAGTSQDENVPGAAPVQENNSILNKYHLVDGLNQWQKVFDISDIPEGPYNIVVRGEDYAGNIIETPAIDINIDPESDKPHASITYPASEMSIPGNMTILGSAEDDDEVAFVEVKLGEGQFRRAEGGDYWSLPFSTDSLEDGVYTITCRATDINNIAGDESSLSFYLNRSVPVINFNSHINGDLVSEKISITGIVQDLNGVRSFSYSTDGGEIWAEAKLKGKLEEGSGDFEVNIDTSSLEPGPRVLQFKSEDMLGSVSDAALLLYIDNTKPVLDIVYPYEDKPENGVFMVAGRAVDDISLASLTWSYKGEDPQGISLSPGNPFWSVMVDFTGKDEMELDFELIDTAGNVSKVQLRRELDLEADKPTIKLTGPLPDENTGYKNFRGWIIDDDAPAALIYRIDKNEEQRLTTGGSFDISLEDLAPGSHILSYRAVDKHGLEGNEETFNFRILPEDPVVDFQVIGNESDNIRYKPGVRFRSDIYSAISGKISFDSGSGSAFVDMTGVDKQQLKLTKTERSGVFSFNLELTDPVPFGYVPIKITAEDSLGSVSETTAFLWVENLSRNLAPFGFDLPETKKIILSEDSVFSIPFIGYPLKSVEIVDNPGFLKIDRQDNRIVISAEGTGDGSLLILKGINDRDVEYSVELPDILADFEAPKVELTELPSEFIKGRISIEGKVTDDLGPVSLSYAVGEGEFRNLGVSEGDGDWKFNLTLNSGEINPEGSIVKIRAKDKAGRESSAYTVLVPETNPETAVKPGIISFIGKAGQDLLSSDYSGNRVFLGAALSGVEKTGPVTYSLDGENPKNLNGFPAASAFIQVPDAGTHSILIATTYGEGKKLSSSLKFVVADDLKEIRFDKFTHGSEIIRDNDTAINVNVPGSLKLAEVNYKIDNTESVNTKVSSSENGNSFSIPLDELSYGRHRFTVNATDSYGRTEESASFFYLLAPKKGRKIDDRSGFYPLTAESGDYSFFFNGRELKDMVFKPSIEGGKLEKDGSVITSSFAQPVNVPDVEINVETTDGDKFSYGPFSMSTDITAPELELSSPVIEIPFSGLLELVGRVSDDLELKEIAYSISGGSFVPFELPADSAGFTYIIDLKDTPEGLFELIVRAEDTAGNFSSVSRLLVHDSATAVYSLILPEPGEEINGLSSLILKVEDEWSGSLNGEFVLAEDSIPVTVEDGFINLSPNFSPFQVVPDQFFISLSDEAGNTRAEFPMITFNSESDKPLLVLQFPRENTVFQDDPKFSFTAFDDDGIREVRYRVDEGEFAPLEVESNYFEIKLSIDSLIDNEHTIEVVATDLQGVESEPFVLPFRISLSPPEAELITPEIGSTRRGKILLEGTAFDANGIESLFLSVDSGNSFHKAVGTESWSYLLDSRVLVDGLYMLLIKVIDNYGVEAITSSLVSVDNTAPLVEVSQPFDGIRLTSSIPVQLRTYDDLSVKSLRYTVTKLGQEEQNTDSHPLLEGEFEPRSVVLEEISTEGLSPGLYNLSIFSYDDAENETIVSRDFKKLNSSDLNSISILFPLSGSSLSPSFRITGRVEGEVLPEEVDISINGSIFERVSVTREGYFTRRILPGELSGEDLVISASVPGLEIMKSDDIAVKYRNMGPWLQINSKNTGSYVSQRPWISGTAGYYDPEAGDPEELPKEERKRRELAFLEYSLDNGRSFKPFKIKGDEGWKFRLESQEIPDGPLNIVVRGEFNTGDKVLDQVFVLSDDTLPQLNVLNPQEGIALNGILQISGTAYDVNGLKDISVMIRPKSKSSYQLPQFIQGLYVDMHFLGASYYEGGVGLTFFDDNVKLQVMAGSAPEGRFNGSVFGLKLLANVATLPYGYFFGPDWDFLSSSLAVGAAFEYFTMTESSADQTGLILGALILQLELAKVEFKKMKMFNTISVYIENQMWFISSDVEGGIANRIAFGLRTSVF